MSATGLSYTIAGPADDEDYAQAEYLAEMLMVSLPSIHCTLKPIMPIDWNDFVKKQASFLGCKQRAPLIWTNSGAVSARRSASMCCARRRSCGRMAGCWTGPGRAR